MYVSKVYIYIYIRKKIDKTIKCIDNIYMEQWLSPAEMESVTRVHILDSAVCLSRRIHHTFVKSMHQFFLANQLWINIRPYRVLWHLYHLKNCILSAARVLAKYMIYLLQKFLIYGYFFLLWKYNTYMLRVMTSMHRVTIRKDIYYWIHPSVCNWIFSCPRVHTSTPTNPRLICSYISIDSPYCNKYIWIKT